MKKQIIKKKYFYINEAIFNRKVHVFLNYSHKEFAAFVRKMGATDYQDDPDYDKNFMAFSSVIEVKNGSDEWVICLKHFDWTIKDQGSLIHEIVHTIIKIWKSNNVPFTPDNQEFLAHSIGNLYEDIVGKVFNKQRK